MEHEILNKLEAIERYTLLAAKNVLCFDDVALLTGFSKSHLYKLTCSHQIPHYKPNGKLCFFSKADLDTWLTNIRVRSQAEIDSDAAQYLVNRRADK